MEKVDRRYKILRDFVLEVFDRYGEGVYIRPEKVYVLYPNGEKEDGEALVDDTLITRIYTDNSVFELDLIEFDFSGNVELIETTIADTEDTYIAKAIRENRKIIFVVENRFTVVLEFDEDGFIELKTWRNYLKKYSE